MAADDRSCRSWTPKVTVAAAVRVAVDVAAVTVGQGLAHESIMSQQPRPAILAAGSTLSRTHRSLSGCRPNRASRSRHISAQPPAPGAKPPPALDALVLAHPGPFDPRGDPRSADAPPNCQHPTFLPAGILRAAELSLPALAPEA